MARILFMVSHDIYVRNYLRTNALQEVPENHTVTVISDSNLALRDEVESRPDHGGSYFYPSNINRAHQLLFQILMWRYQAKSPTFRFRWMRMAQWPTFAPDESLLARVSIFLRWLIPNLANGTAMLPPLLGNRLVFPVSSRILKRRVPVNQSLEDLVVRHKPDLIVFPSAAYESSGIDAIRIGRKLEIPTLSLIDNWDNLTSKTVYWVKPNHLGVWGEQALNQAVEVHNFDPAQIHLIGTPRFDQYFLSRRAFPEAIHNAIEPPKPYVLFVGSAMPFDEIESLQVIESILASNGFSPSDIRILYRPHPWQHKRKVSAIFSPLDFTYTDLDPQILAAYDSGVTPGITDTSFQPDLSYYPQLLSGARCVVGPLTTMLFEAVLCLKPVVALAYNDGFHASTSRRYFSHFDGMENIPGFSFCEEEEALESALLNALGQARINQADSDAHSRYFLFRDHLTYPERLSRLITALAPPAP